jgi:hypothetical protein
MTDEAKQKVSFLDDVKPAWTYVAQVCLIALEDGTDAGITEAKSTVMHMAQVADKAVFYRSLLQKYIEHVGSREGFTFLDDLDVDTSFTNEEKAELLKLNAERQS